MLNTIMNEAKQILNTMTEEQLLGFIMMFRKNEKPMEEAIGEERTRKRAAAERIKARRKPLPADFDYKKVQLGSGTIK